MHPIHERIIAINREQSARYTVDEPARRRYWAKHPTFIGCVKCMDGRVHLPVMTKTPTGLVKPFRAIGGKFDIWWPSFLGRVRHWAETAMHMGGRAFLFVTYHYSASDPHLGCAGWQYDTSAARAHAEKLCAELGYVFGDQLTAVPTGVETDRDVLTLHGLEGDVSGDGLRGHTLEEVHDAIARAFPKMPRQVVEDLAPLLHGNARRVEELARSPREQAERGHNERIIAVGQGFNWLAQANLALIINDADPNLADSIRVASSLIAKNFTHAPMGDDATIFTCIPYREPGIDYRQAVARSRGLCAFTERVIREAQPELIGGGRLHALAGVIWEPNKALELVEASAVEVQRA